MKDRHAKKKVHLVKEIYEEKVKIEKYSFFQMLYWPILLLHGNGNHLREALEKTEGDGHEGGI